MSDIRRYLAERDAASVRGLERGSMTRAIRRVSSWEFRQAAKLNATTLLVPSSKRKISRLVREQTPLLLHLGCGPRRLPGWVNIDIFGMHPDLHWDLRRGVPFPNDSADAVFLEHVIEHFPLGDVLDLLDECHRVLAPAGIIRLGVPDFGSYLRSYATDGEVIERLRPGRPTRLLAVAEVALSHGHRSVWDGPTLERVLSESGFVAIGTREFGDSDLDPTPDSPMREAESVYAEGRKPETSQSQSA
jgi:predicted SAM-dependent methyltransferase